MMQAQSWRSAMVAMGNAHIRESSESLDNVVKALRGEISLFEMSVETYEKRVPLDIYLAIVKQVTEVDEFFTGAPLFDIWVQLPVILTHYHESLGISHDMAQKLLERFNAYTWNEHTPELRKEYMDALRKTLWTADGREFTGWRAYSDVKPELTQTIDLIIENPEFSQLNSIYALRERRAEIKEIENEVEQIPPERVLDLFTPNGYKRMSKRGGMINDLEPRLKGKAQEIIDPLTKLGDEYRRIHISRYYHHLL